MFVHLKLPQCHQVQIHCSQIFRKSSSTKSGSKYTVTRKSILFTRSSVFEPEQQPHGPAQRVAHPVM